MRRTARLVLLAAAGLLHVGGSAAWAQGAPDSGPDAAATPSAAGSAAAPLSDLEKLQRLIEQKRAQRAAGGAAAPLSDLEKLQRLIEQQRAQRAARRPPGPPAPSQTPAPVDGHLTLKLPPVPGAVRLAIDGVDRGTVEPASVTPIALAPGPHEVRVTRPGFAPVVRTVRIRPGQKTALAVRLKATAAVLSVDADVPDAEIRVDGVLVGKTPIVGLELPPRVVSVSARRDGYLDADASVVLALGEQSELFLKLPRDDKGAALAGARGEPTRSPTAARADGASGAAGRTVATAPPSDAAADRPVERPLVPTEAGAWTGAAEGPEGAAERLTEATAAGASQGPGEGTASPGAAQGRSGVAWYVWTAAAVAVAAAGAGAAYYVYARPLTAAEVCAPETCGGCINMTCLRAAPLAPSTQPVGVLRW